MKPLLDLPLSDTVLPDVPCQVVRGAPVMAPVVFASPHSGLLYPPDLQAQLQVPIIDLRRTEDAFVDELFACAPAQGAVLISANYARTYVDLNRDARELDASMFADGVPRTCGLPSARVEAGLGCLPRVGASGREIYGEKLSRAEGARRLDHIHDGYHAVLGAELERLKLDWSDIVLIDCHSMPSVQPGRSGLPDIVLGDRFGSSCDGALTGVVERRFRHHGLSVSRNAPYAGGYTTRRYGRPRSGVHALQIELNRDLYMHEVSVEKSASFGALSAVLSDVIDAVMAFALRESG